MLDQDSLRELCLSVFDGTKAVTLWFVLPLFLLKCAYSQLLGNDQGIRDAAKGLIVYFILTISFGEVLDVLFAIPHHFFAEDQIAIQEQLQKIDAADPKTLWEKTLSVSALIPQLVTKIIEMLTAVLFWLMVILHAALMVVLSSMAPIIFLTAALLGIGMGIPLFFGLLIAASSWPVLFYGFDHSLLWLYQNIPDPFGRSVAEMAIVFLKAISPIGLAFLSLSSPAGQAMTSSVKNIISGGKLISKSGNTTHNLAIKPQTNLMRKELFRPKQGPQK